MIRGLYAAASGMVAGQFVQDSLASNLANLNTAGFKQDIPTFRALQDMAIRRYDGYQARKPGDSTSAGEVGMGVVFDHNTTDLAPGTNVRTGSPTDLALNGSGFFALQTPQGERYSRAGHFHVDATDKNGYLVDDNNNRVLGQKGPIALANVKELKIMPNGEIQADGKVIDQLKIVDFAAASLRKEGGNLFSATGPAAKAKAIVQQEYVEQSNVSAISAMIQMIAVQRAYESAAKAVTAQDETLGKAVNEVGKV
jgi:flagellar basal-body rod protein FlgF